MTDAAPVEHPGSLGLIWAQARGGVIGAGGTMPWHLPEDLAHFRAATMGAPVIMGRRTWESFPDRFRPLPGRRNIVVTRDPEWVDAGAEAVGSLDEALALYPAPAPPRRAAPESAPRGTRATPESALRATGASALRATGAESESALRATGAASESALRATGAASESALRATGAASESALRATGAASESALRATPESALRATLSASAPADVARTAMNGREHEDDALPSPDAWVIGGGELYRAAIDRADVLEVTEIDLDVDGDTMAPEIGASSWRLASVDPRDGWRTSRTGLRYRFLTYRPDPGVACTPHQIPTV